MIYVNTLHFFFSAQSMKQLKFKLMFPIQYPAYQNGNKLISQDFFLLLLENPIFISWPESHDHF